MVGRTKKNEEGIREERQQTDAATAHYSAF